MIEQPKYAIQFSAHGCAWVPEKPKFIYTLKEAETIRAEWLARADTVGGDVLITAEPPHIHLPCFPPDKECWPKGGVFY